MSASTLASSAYRTDAIPPLPEPPKARKRSGEELLPFGDYAGIDPHQQLCEDAEMVQYQEAQDLSFYQSRDWWWDHQRIRFLKSQVGLSILLTGVPIIWLMTLLGVVLYLTINVPSLLFGRGGLALL